MSDDNDNFLRTVSFDAAVSILNMYEKCKNVYITVKTCKENAKILTYQ